MVVSGGLCFRNAFPTREVIAKRDQIELIVILTMLMSG